MIVRAKIIAVDSFGAIVQFPGGLKALCPLRHMSEFEIAKPRKKFKVGKIIFLLRFTFVIENGIMMYNHVIVLLNHVDDFKSWSVLLFRLELNWCSVCLVASPRELPWHTRKLLYVLLELLGLDLQFSQICSTLWCFQKLNLLWNYYSLCNFSWFILFICCINNHVQIVSWIWFFAVGKITNISCMKKNKVKKRIVSKEKIITHVTLSEC